MALQWITGVALVMADPEEPFFEQFPWRPDNAAFPNVPNKNRQTKHLLIPAVQRSFVLDNAPFH